MSTDRMIVDADVVIVGAGLILFQPSLNYVEAHS